VKAIVLKDTTDDSVFADRDSQFVLVEIPGHSTPFGALLLRDDGASMKGRGANGDHSRADKSIFQFNSVLEFGDRLRWQGSIAFHSVKFGDFIARMHQLIAKGSIVREKQKSFRKIVQSSD
jgi:hypothetical protein